MRRYTSLVKPAVGSVSPTLAAGRPGNCKRYAQRVGKRRRQRQLLLRLPASSASVHRPSVAGSSSAGRLAAPEQNTVKQVRAVHGESYSTESSHSVKFTASVFQRLDEKSLCDHFLRPGNFPAAGHHIVRRRYVHGPK